MKNLKKSTIAVALSAALVAGLSATSVNAAQQSPAAAGDPFVSVNGTGQALVFPYYTVRGGYQSFFNITNTSEFTIPVKVRFREGLNSRDALDFIIVLSPHDVWAGYITEAADGSGPVVKSRDNTCAVGAPLLATSGQPLSALGYNYAPSSLAAAERFADQGDQTIDRAREGYLEVIAMGKARTEAEAFAVDAKHSKTTGKPRDCGTSTSATGVNADFRAPGGQLEYPLPEPTDAAWLGGTGSPPAQAMVVPLKEGENPLKGNFSIIDSSTGIGAGNTAVAIADFMDATTLGASGNLVTAQNFPYFLEPTLASRQGVWTTAGLGLVDDALKTKTIANEWANNANSGAHVDWVVNFPTKSFYVDNETSTGAATTLNIQASRNKWRTGSTTLTGAGFAWADINSNGANAEITLLNFDREEKSATADPGETQPSPAPVIAADSVVLPRETNVITSSTDLSLRAGLKAKSYVPSPAAMSLGKPNGWTAMSFTNGDYPAIGFAFKLRNQGDTNTSYGQIMDHAYSDEVILAVD